MNRGCYNTKEERKQKKRDREKEWIRRNPEKFKTITRRYREKHREEILLRQRKYRERNKEELNRRARERYHLNIEKQRKRSRDKKAKEKYEVFSYYSHGEPKCACCGQTGLIFLTIDHIYGRKPNEPPHRAHLYHWLKMNNYPEGYQILCWNCNAAKGILGICPHQVNNGKNTARLK